LQALRTPLHSAAFTGQVEVATLLIDRGAKLEAQGSVRAAAAPRAQPSTHARAAVTVPRCLPRSHTRAPLPHPS
jgi:ankyrin repeat protein